MAHRHYTSATTLYDLNHLQGQERGEEKAFCSRFYFAVAETSTEAGLIPAAFTARMTK